MKNGAVAGATEVWRRASLESNVLKGRNYIIALCEIFPVTVRVILKFLFLKIHLVYFSQVRALRVRFRVITYSRGRNNINWNNNRKY